MNYKSKYLKYKLKYLITKKLLGGSSHTRKRSDRPKSAPTTPYENEQVRIKVTNYPGKGDRGEKPGILEIQQMKDIKKKQRY